MDVKELRVGNYIAWRNFYSSPEVAGIINGDEDRINGVKACYFNGIPLTEEWLRSFRFDKPAHSWCGDKFHLSNYDKDESLWCVAINKNNAIVANIKYVHELQNLYFAIAGKELETE